MKILLVIGLGLAVLVSCTENKTTKKNALEDLVSGNERFISGHPLHPNETLLRMRNLKKGQEPFVVLVSCSDSRVPPELIFDQGLGDIFSVRTAGNVIGDYELGSIEYAVEHLGCRLVVVMGHQECGAVKAYLQHRDHYEHHDHIRHIVDYMGFLEDSTHKHHPDSMTTDLAVELNIRHGVSIIKNSEPLLKTMSDKGELEIIGALYELETGTVRFYRE
jgi:carbonic anhydrase